MGIKTVKLDEVQSAYLKFYCISFSAWVKMNLNDEMKRFEFFKEYERRRKKNGR